MRDRLIEVITEHIRSAWHFNDSFAYFYESIVPSLADYLLANGVIAPPVVLGSRQKVYIPIKGTTVVYETKVYGIGVDEDGDMVINPREYPEDEDVISMNGYNLDKTVFLTREEAEAKLKEGDG